jgi:hypothetical protein
MTRTSSRASLRIRLRDVGAEASVPGRHANHLLAVGVHGAAMVAVALAPAATLHAAGAALPGWGGPAVVAAQIIAVVTLAAMYRHGRV